MFRSLLCILLFCMLTCASAQNAVPFLNYSPDARGASLGYSGVSNHSDVNSQFWNSSKYAFLKNNSGISGSFSPWFLGTAGSSYMGTISAYWKPSEKQAISSSIRYLFYGTAEINNEIELNPEELAIDFAYSKMLNENLSIGLALRYIGSKIFISSFQYYRNGYGISGDLSMFFSKNISIVGLQDNISFGVNISNIGGQINYGKESKDINNNIPTVFRIGATFTSAVDYNNNLSVSLECNKVRNESSPSFSMGVEYSHFDELFLRMGYYSQCNTYSKINYISVGTGFAFHEFIFDIAYIIPSIPNMSLGNTFNLSISYSI